MGMFKDILSVSGQSGLFKFLSKGRNGIIVEALDTNKRIHINASTKVSALEDIAIYSNTAEVPLFDVFKSINEKYPDNKIIDSKEDAEKIKAFFAEILPDYDQEKVYVSDMKKVIKWYQVMADLKLLDFTEEKAEEKADADTNDKKEEKTATETKTVKESKIKTATGDKTTKKATNTPPKQVKATTKPKMTASKLKTTGQKKAS